ncbi:MAG: phytoene desaturase family protein [Spirochaetaceae bacterium]
MVKSGFATDTLQRKRVAIVGAGLGGLSAAIRLSAAGMHVKVYEQSSHAGGKAGTLSLGGYRFDTGPSLITMRHVFDELLQVSASHRGPESQGGKPQEGKLTFVPLDPICTYYFSDGTVFNARSQPHMCADEAAAVFGEKPSHILRFLEHSRNIYRRTAPLFLEGSLHTLDTNFGKKVLKGIFSRGRLDTHKTMDEANRRFFRDTRLVQLFNRYATYNGSNPYKVPGTLNIIPHVEYNMGAFAAEEGIYSIPSALFSRAEELGVQFLFNTRIDKIIRDDRDATGRESTRSRRRRENRRVKGRVTGLAFNGGSEEADVVVSNVDARLTYESLLDDYDAPYAARYRRLEPSSSGLVFFWGMKSSYPELGVNNIFFSDNYPKEFDAIFNELRCPDNPTVYVNITSKVSVHDAPGGGENWFVLVNAPRNAGQDWPGEEKRMRSAVLERVSRALGKNVADDISVEQTLNPSHIEAETGSIYGSLYGISSNTKTAAFLRHPANTGRYENLYFTGGSVHPGGGMPLAILSGKIAAELILKRQ